MDEDDYTRAITMCYLAARALKDLDLPRVIEAMNKADTIGPFLDPALWMAKRTDMRDNRNVIEAALPLWRLAQKLKEERDEHAKEGE